MIPNVQNIHLPPNLLGNFRELRKRAVKTAKLNPDIPSYIIIPWINEKWGMPIDSVEENKAAEIIHYVFKKTNPTHIIGIEKSGISFAKSVLKKFEGAEFILVKKYRTKPQLSQDELLFSADSYSEQEKRWFILPKLPKEARVFITDDVCARGHVAYGLCRTLATKEVNIVGFGVYYDKVFQQGLAKIERDFKIPVFSVIRIAEIKDEKIVLLKEELSLKI